MQVIWLRPSSRKQEACPVQRKWARTLQRTARSVAKGLSQPKKVLGCLFVLGSPLFTVWNLLCRDGITYSEQGWEGGSCKKRVRLSPQAIPRFCQVDKVDHHTGKSRVPSQAVRVCIFSPPASQPRFLPYLPSFLHSGRTSLLILWDTSHTPASGFSHKYFPVPGVIFAQVSTNRAF